MQRDRLIVYEMCDVWPAFAKKLYQPFRSPLFLSALSKARSQTGSRKSSLDCVSTRLAPSPYGFTLNGGGGGDAPFSPEKVHPIAAPTVRREYGACLGD